MYAHAHMVITTRIMLDKLTQGEHIRLMKWTTKFGNENTRYIFSNYINCKHKACCHIRYIDFANELTIRINFSKAIH